MATPAASIDPFIARTRIAYFSMEIALRPEIHTYAGGLGILAGDTARSCADLELPVVLVTLASHDGYFRQSIDSGGVQHEGPDPWSIRDWAHPLGAKISLEIEGRDVWIRPWLYVLKSPLGYEIPILFLDTDVEENDPADRNMTHRLYGGNETYRLKQEIVLGIGGSRLLRALGFDIHTFHLNEGHAALLALDILRRHRRKVSEVVPGECLYDTSPVRDMCIFTTHTPVEAGVDQFSYDLVERLLGRYMDIDQLKILAGKDRLNMTRLALNLSGFVNGVAERHAVTTRTLYPGYRVRAITNGVHAPTWAAPGFRRLYQKHFPNWAHEPEVLVRADQLSDDEVWAAHEEAKGALIEKVQDASGQTLDPDLPILAFARRMTGYKRPDLLFTDMKRLLDVHQRHPFQIVLGGKAHPHDRQGKALIQEIHEYARAYSDRIRIIFVPNYDMELASFLVSGADVWLNTPLPPLEASGTSGMKAAMNGVLNLSVLDGWWIEACVEGVTGWAVGIDGEMATGPSHAEDLYRKLRDVVLPLYYNDRPRWIWMMKESISKIAYYFNSQRMMRRYASEAYLR